MKVNVRKFPLDFFVSERGEKTNIPTMNKKEIPRVKWNHKFGVRKEIVPESKCENKIKIVQPRFTVLLPKRCAFSQRMHQSLNYRDSIKNETKENIL